MVPHTLERPPHARTPWESAALYESWSTQPLSTTSASTKWFTKRDGHLRRSGVKSMYSATSATLWVGSCGRGEMACDDDTTGQ